MYTIIILHPILPCSEKQNAEAENIDLDQLLSILNSQTATAQDSEQAKVERMMHWAHHIPSVFPTRKGTANAQGELAQAQEPTALALLGIAIAAALVGAGASRALDEIPLQQQARAQGPKKIAGIIAGGAAGGAVSGGVNRAINGQVRAEDIDLAELISLIGNHQAVQQDAANAQEKITGKILAGAVSGGVGAGVGRAINGANAQEKFTAKIVGAVAGGAAGGAVGGGISRIPLQQQARAQGPKKIAGIIAGGAAGGAVSGGVNRAINGQVRAEDIDLAELISLIGNHQAVQQDAAKTQRVGEAILDFLRDNAVPELRRYVANELIPLVADYLANVVQPNSEQAKIEGGLTLEDFDYWYPQLEDTRS